jgi:hypothetical protein
VEGHIRTALPGLPLIPNMGEGARARERTIRERRSRSNLKSIDIGTHLIKDLIIGKHIWLQELKTRRWNIPAMVL